MKICSICQRELEKDEEPWFIDETIGVNYIICVQCSKDCDNGGGIATEDDDPNNDPGEFGFGGNWWNIG